MSNNLIKINYLKRVHPLLAKRQENFLHEVQQS